MDPSDPAHAGQAVYSKSFLRIYDIAVVRLSNSFVWRCPANTLLDHYQSHVTTSHLDVGPGTGYYLDRVHFPGDSPALTLLDPNPDVLQFTSNRLRRYSPMTHAADALKPIGLAPQSFRSVALGFVLHCLPGDLAAKSVVFDNVSPLVETDGVIFGSTILGEGVDHTRLARKLIHLYNRKRIFSNSGDGLDGLSNELSERFTRYEVEVVGSVALFAAWVDRTTRDNSSR
ncbi:MAG: class I SAM-dependent methyltransferase [Nocardioidaceae bacterium]